MKIKSKMKSMETAYKKVIGYKYLIRQNLENPDFLRFSQKQNVRVEIEREYPIATCRKTDNITGKSKGNYSDKNSFALLYL